jgi:proline iminopeptidase
MKLKKLIGISLAELVTIAGLGIGGALVWRSSLQSQTANSRTEISNATGVDELFNVKIGGIDQWFHARGISKVNPVLLWVREGPGTQLMPFEALFQKEIEKSFIIVHWDQRGAGKTYTENPKHDHKTSMTYDRMVADEVIDMLTARYGKDKVVIVGHSWGSMLALGLIEARPNSVSAYVGTGQVVDVALNETTGYHAAIAEARRLNNSVALKELESIAPYPEANGETLNEKTTLLRKWQNNFGLGISRLHRDKIEKIMLNTALATPEYSLLEVNYFRLDTSQLSPKHEADVDAFKASKWGTEYKIPMFQFLGRHDFQTPSSLAATWFTTIKAPHKALVWFEASAHSPMVDEPTAFAKALTAQVRPYAVTPEVPSNPPGSKVIPLRNRPSQHKG